MRAAPSNGIPPSNPMLHLPLLGHILCGEGLHRYSHSIAVVDEHNVFTWGSAAWAQLGTLLPACLPCCDSGTTSARAPPHCVPL
jgi:hypothetical protein